MPLVFEVQDLQREMRSFQRLSRSFLDLSSTPAIEQAIQSLSQIATASSAGIYDWEIREYLPIRTAMSTGEYMPDARGELHVHAVITYIWQLRPLRDTGDSRAARKVELAGKASTCIRLLEGEPGFGVQESEVAMWRMEIADDFSPGAYFHVQILGREEDEKFPHSLDVPRLPGTLVSPFACTEFILAELFQDRWSAHADRDFQDVRDWRTVQARRLRQQLSWHLEQIENTAGSPWSSWKRARPPSTLFLRRT